MTQRMSLDQFKNLPKADNRQRGKPRRQEEHDHQAALFKILKLNCGRFPFLKFIFAVPNAAKRNKKTSAILKAEGLTAGVPDINIPFQRRGYPGAVIENKAGYNTLSDAQKEFKAHYESEGYCFKTCRSIDEQIEFIEWYFGINLTRNK